MSDIERMEQLIRENERMASALIAIKTYANSCLIGAWRQYVYDLAKVGLRKD